MANILRHTKMVKDAFIEDKGSLKIDTSSVIGRMKLDDKVMSFLARYVDFIMNSGIISEVTKIYLKSIENNPSDAIRTHNQLGSGFGEIGSKKATNHIYYDTKRLSEFFPDDMILNIINKKGDLAVYEVMLQNAINKRFGKSLLGQLSILKTPNIIEKEKPSEQELDQFFMIFAPYTKEIVKGIEEQLPRNVVGYLNYISSKSNLDEEEKSILDRLKQIGEALFIIE